MSMKKECESASGWWTTQINATIAPPLDKEQLSTFQQVLCQILEEKYRNHWYADEPERGSAFRSIIYDNRTIDQVLLDAASRAKIHNLKTRLSNEVIMWVDPNQIQVQFSHSPRRHVIYGNPLATESMFDPSVLRGAAVYNTSPINSSSSSGSSSPTSLPISTRASLSQSKGIAAQDQQRIALAVNM